MERAQVVEWQRGDVATIGEHFRLQLVQLAFLRQRKGAINVLINEVTPSLILLCRPCGFRGRTRRWFMASDGRTRGTRLQRVQGFVEQRRDRLAGLARQRGQDPLLFGGECKWCLFHVSTVPRKPGLRNDVLPASAVQALQEHLADMDIPLVRKHNTMRAVL